MPRSQELMRLSPEGPPLRHPPALPSHQSPTTWSTPTIEPLPMLRSSNFHLPSPLTGVSSPQQITLPWVNQAVPPTLNPMQNSQSLSIVNNRIHPPLTSPPNNPNSLIQSFQQPVPPAFNFHLPLSTQQIFSRNFPNFPSVRPALELRQIIENAEVATHQIIEPSPFVSAKIHNRLDLMHSLKQRLFDAAGIGPQVSAPDDGTFWTDLILTEDQSMYLINQLNYFGRRKRYSVFMEGFPAYKWEASQPVPYTFDANVASHERTIVQNALSQIEAKSCIRFQYYPTKPNSNYIYYTKMANPSLCGLSYIGRTMPANPVYLSFSCPDFSGVVIHETMHALGVNHHHQRSDRDNYRIRINWENIDPQKYDYFAVADPSIFTTYGVPYDYYSIMSYAPKLGTLPPYNKQSFTPLQNPSQYLPFLGQRKFISNGDSELINKMYCKNPDCMDMNVYCGAWTNLRLCQAPAQYGWMIENCQKSCGFC